MRADLSHQEDAIAPIADRLAHDLLGLAVVVFPRVVHERDAGVNRGVHDSDAFARRCGFGDVITAQANRRHEYIGFAETSTRDVHASSSTVGRLNATRAPAK